MWFINAYRHRDKIDASRLGSLANVSQNFINTNINPSFVQFLCVAYNFKGANDMLFGSRVCWSWNAVKPIL